ncbi:MerR family transcriptional regulator [Neisseria mucosa]|uniref:MerR family transcriptional regulator n=1 Tax=Neisseria mucosa TaxID=488 RepID=A0ABN4YD05_NEIMU|nr:chaperone modulator CbpM [Neisseria mucosa]ARC51848.1 MerR family transcriptional regulator [Neisseria mucosa]OFT25059.1 MerR family transcriptional regulator [Neisseria sp. HMSC03D10]
MTQSTDITLTFEEIIAVSHCRRDWLLELIEEDIISIGGKPEQTTFSGFHLARIRRAQRLSRDFEAGIPALGLIMRLLDEVEELRKAQRPSLLLEEEGQ